MSRTDSDLQINRFWQRHREAICQLIRTKVIAAIELWVDDDPDYELDVEDTACEMVFNDLEGDPSLIWGDEEDEANDQRLNEDREDEAKKKIKRVIRKTPEFIAFMEKCK